MDKSLSIQNAKFWCNGSFLARGRIPKARVSQSLVGCVVFELLSVAVALECKGIVELKG